ncbi:MAG TPA: hypothetical protein VGQ44_17305 [Gemmatimonadaceae bacterium]|jgi:hypothetical protein|nr:hypothetical protein [Gemmatimonadaceae bacterium]
MAQKLKPLCVFGPDSAGGTTIADLRALLANPEYSGDDAAITILQKGKDFFARVSNAEGAHPTDLNEATQCPGSPRC